MSGWINLDDMTSGFAACCKAFAAYHLGQPDWRGDTAAAHYGLTVVYGLPWSPTRAPSAEEVAALDELGAEMERWRAGGAMTKGVMIDLMARVRPAVDYVHETTGAGIWTVHAGPPARCSPRPAVSFADLSVFAAAVPDHAMETSGALPWTAAAPGPASHAAKHRLACGTTWRPRDDGYDAAMFDLWLPHKEPPAPASVGAWV